MNKLDKSIKNARVAFGFYFVFLVVSFVSRKIFIETLGTELVGLSATMQNILGFLNLAELGIYSAVTYALYKPLVDKNHDEISKIISLFGYLYRLVGIFIGVVGLILAIFMPFIFKKTDVSLLYIYASYATFLTLALVSYFNNYRQILLAADQRNYTVTRITNYINLAKVLLQIIVLKYLTSNYLIWLALEFISGFVIRHITNRKVIKDYPWLVLNLANGKKLIKEYKTITTNIKNLFIHKFAEFAVGQTNQFIIFAFTSLTMVTYYTNYMMIFRRIAALLSQTLGSNVAAVGHVVAENNSKKTLDLFSEFNALFFFTAGLFVFCLFFLTEPFIALWLGNEFILPKFALVFIAIEFYIAIIRRTVMFFINGYGLYHDVWAAGIEAVINIAGCIIGGYFYGLIGILGGGLISSLVIVMGWKPYFLFSLGFKTSVWKYWKEVIIYILLFIVSLLAACPLLKFLPEPNNYGLLIVNAIVIFVGFSIIYGLLLYLLAPGSKKLVNRLTNKFLRKNE